ncbi:MAG: Gfo/Idh/MocA family oxidoreductase, partial [Nitrospinota bacterium]|nr:Gfo/Idh/MocA family oxidoreductase [Nitrospinota bacterium]
MVEFCVSVLMAINFFLRKFDIYIIGFYNSMEKEAMIKVGMAGVGYWGKHLARNLNELGVLASVIDSDPNQLVWAKGKFHGIRATATIKEALAAGDIDALVIATPPQTHFSIARQALEAGCHVLIEKPFTCSSKEAGELVRVAENKGLVLMGGFTFLYNNAVRKVKEIIQSGELGQVYYVFSQRLNLGRVRSDVDIWWNLAPHD